jgi:Zn-dependent metalloprotease
MFFGESSTGFPMTALDVVSHELTHGVINFALIRRTGRPLGDSLPQELGPSSVVLDGKSFSCATTTFAGRPFYCINGRYITVSNHAGALNEGLADVFGTAVEFAYQPAGNGPQKADYLMGEDIPRPGGFEAPVRSLENPALVVIDPGSGLRYPDNYSRRIAFAVIIVNGALAISSLAIVGGNGAVLDGIDDGAVHFNSTILSHAFYLAIEGGQNRTSGQTVQGVGAANRSQIEQVFFRAIRDLIPSGVTFPQMAAALRQASLDLYGASGAPTRAVDQALTAVGL